MNKPFKTKQELLDYLLEGVEEQVEQDMKRLDRIFPPKQVAIDHTCPCGIYTHPSRVNPNAIHIGPEKGAIKDVS